MSALRDLVVADIGSTIELVLNDGATTHRATLTGINVTASYGNDPTPKRMMISLKNGEWRLHVTLPLDHEITFPDDTDETP